MPQSGQIEKALRTKFPDQVDQAGHDIGRLRSPPIPMSTCQTDVLVDLKPGTFQREKLVGEMSAILARSFRSWTSATPSPSRCA